MLSWQQQRIYTQTFTFQQIPIYFQEKSPNLVELYFSFSELWAKNLKGDAEHPPPPGMDRINDKINHEQYDKVTGAVDFRDRMPSKDGMPVEGVDFDKILVLLPLKMLIFLQFIPAKQGYLIKYSRDARAEAV